MKNRLQRFSSAFPGGWPGLGLLLLRAAVGMTSVVEGFFCISRDNPTWTMWAIGLLAIAGGASLVIGLLTTVASVVVGVAAVWFAISLSPAPTPSMFDAALPTVLVVVVAAAVVFLGPGALSLDARRFGRREIIIPRTPPRPEP